jgi:hypothetical protein
MGMKWHPGAVLALLLSSAIGASAQQTDPRWTAWLGCWQLIEEQMRDASDDPSVPREFTAAPGGIVCVTPAAEPNGVTLTTSVESQSTLEETIVADATRRSLREPGCEGWQQAEWSATGRRLLARAELTCAQGSRRTVSGLALIGRDRIWTDIQVVEEGGRESIRVRHYRRAPDQKRAAGALSSSDLVRAAAVTARQAAPLTIDEVKEALGKLPMSAIEAALIETNTGFPLNSKRLTELSDAGVPGRVIDLMVALSFPNRFVVEKRSASSGASSYPLGPGFQYGDLYDWPYYYAPFGYSLLGRYDTYYFGAPGYAVVDAAPVGPQPSGLGRVVDGLGYTRVRSREPVGRASGGDGGGAGLHGGNGSSGGSSSGGSVSGSGYSGGGGDSGRTAVARPPQ